MEQLTPYLPYIGVVLGVLSRAIAPYLVKLYKNTSDKINWEWKYLRGQLILSALAFVVLPLLIPNLGQFLANANWQEAWSMGWSISAVGRLMDKVVEKNGV